MSEKSRFEIAGENLELIETLLLRLWKTAKEGSELYEQCWQAVSFIDCWKPWLLDPFREKE